MTGQGWLQIVLFLGVVLLLAKPLGTYMARVFEGKRILGMDRALGPVERLIYKVGGIDRKKDMGWKRYVASVLMFSLVGFILLYLLQRVQSWLPGGPQGLATCGRIWHSIRPSVS
jgi:K+-transporting ATPase ATPase A chain